MKFAALGRTHWLRDAVRAAVQRGHEVVLVATAEAMPEYACDATEFERLARELGAAFLETPRLSDPDPDAVARIREAGAEIGVSVNWPTLIGADVRALFPRGVINAHAGALPRFRGNACPNWAILAGESSVTVTLHQMADELDSGPILLQRDCPLTESTYIGDVYAFMGVAIPDMFVEVLDRLEAGTITPREQSVDPVDALRCYPLRPEDGYLDWTRPATDLARIVRASAEPFAGAFFLRDGQRVIVWRARAERLASPSLGVPGQVIAIRRDSGQVAVLTGDGALVIEQVQRDGGDRESPAAMIRSTRERLTFDPIREMLRLARRVADLEAKLGPR